jgi:hypothetical protein
VAVAVATANESDGSRSLVRTVFFACMGICWRQERPSGAFGRQKPPDMEPFEPAYRESGANRLKSNRMRSCIPINRGVAFRPW